jgi:hypothetical protein
VKLCALTDDRLETKINSMRKRGNFAFICFGLVMITCYYKPNIEILYKYPVKWRSAGEKDRIKSFYFFLFDGCCQGNRV